MKLHRSVLLLFAILVMFSGIAAKKQDDPDKKKEFPSGHTVSGEFLEFYQSVQDPARVFGNPITEVLDTIDRAREHAELDGGFKAVADQLERAVASAGLTRFGAPGDAFDPTIHEALSHLGTDPEVEVITCKVIAKAGYKINDRVVRAAQVLVVDPAEG